MTTTAAPPRPQYTAQVAPEGHWWVITVPELPAGRVTQCRRLDEVELWARDLIATMTGADPASFDVRVAYPSAPPVALGS
jgi:hypothetical protein